MKEDIAATADVHCGLGPEFDEGLTEGLAEQIRGRDRQAGGRQAGLGAAMIFGSGGNLALSNYVIDSQRITSGEQAIENVPGYALDNGVVAVQAVAPVGGASGEHRATARIGAHDRVVV